MGQERRGKHYRSQPVCTDIFSFRVRFREEASVVLPLAVLTLRSINCTYTLLDTFLVLFLVGHHSSKLAIGRGPPLARVERVDITDECEADDTEFASFEIRRGS